MTTTNTTKYAVLGTTDTESTCHCCGKTNLKKTVALAPLDAEGNHSGDPVFFGTTCAARAMNPARSFTKSTATKALYEAGREDHNRRHRAALEAFLSTARTLYPHNAANRFGNPAQWNPSKAFAEDRRDHYNRTGCMKSFAAFTAYDAFKALDFRFTFNT